MSSTPYDDVFRTMLNDCPKLVLAVVNEAFGEHYTGEEKIIFAQNEHFRLCSSGKKRAGSQLSAFGCAVPAPCKDITGHNENPYLYARRQPGIPDSSHKTAKIRAERNF